MKRCPGNSKVIGSWIRVMGLDIHSIWPIRGILQEISGQQQQWLQVYGFIWASLIKRLLLRQTVYSEYNPWNPFSVSASSTPDRVGTVKQRKKAKILLIEKHFFNLIGFQKRNPGLEQDAISQVRRGIFQLIWWNFLNGNLEIKEGYQLWVGG